MLSSPEPVISFDRDYDDPGATQRIRVDPLTGEVLTPRASSRIDPDRTSRVCVDPWTGEILARLHNCPVQSPSTYFTAPRPTVDIVTEPSKRFALRWVVLVSVASAMVGSTLGALLTLLALE